MIENTEEKKLNENIPFFNIDGNDIVKLDEEEYDDVGNDG